MNEKQRLESQQVHAENPADKKSEKDYSKYFQAVYIPPSLKDAKKRGKEEVNIMMILRFQKSSVEWEKEKSFTFVHTDVK